jgi:hypothetical protein
MRETLYMTTSDIKKRLETDPLLKIVWENRDERDMRVLAGLWTRHADAKNEKKRNKHAERRKEKIAKLQSEFLENVAERDKQLEIEQNAARRVRNSYSRANQIALDIARATYGKRVEFSEHPRTCGEHPGRLLLWRVVGLDYVVYNTNTTEHEKLTTGHLE